MNDQTKPSQVPCPIRLEFKFKDGARFKSIGDLLWDDIPPFAIITGLNGSGKSQFLELLALKLTHVFPPGMSEAELRTLRELELTIEGDTFGPESIGYLPSRWYLTERARASMAELQDARRNLFGNLQQNTNSNIHSSISSARMRAAAKFNFNGEEEFGNSLPADYSCFLEQDDGLIGLAYVFVAYRLQFAQELEKETPREQIVSLLGPAPWEVVNATFSASGFPYEVVSPLEKPLSEPYNLLLRNRVNNALVIPGDLSSGEKMIMMLVVWLFKSERHGLFPRLLLLDEPDANLHPSLTRQFMTVIHDVLIKRFGVRVIMTTHSPSTIALAPPESVFEMVRDEIPRIRRSNAVSETIGLLTSGFVVVSAGTRLVLVEDKADVDFYEAVRDVLTDYGPSKIQGAIPTAPSLVFVASSRKDRNEQIGGGSSVVTGWLSKLDAPPLDEIVRGVIDLDHGNTPNNRLAVLSRYSIENYLVEPFVVFGSLNSRGSAPAIPGCAISMGDEHLIRELSEECMQRLVDTVTSEIEKSLPPFDVTVRESVVVEFTNGKKVRYPKWALEMRGHTLLSAYQKAFGGNFISPPKLLESFRRVRLVPKELSEMLRSLQK